MKRWVWILAITVTWVVNVWSQTEADQALLLLQATQPSALSHDDATGNISFLRWQNPLTLPAGSRFAKAQYFLAVYGPAFGLKAGASTFEILHEERDVAGNFHLRLQCLHEGIPMFSGNLNFHFNSAQALLGLDGLVLPNINQPEIAQWSPEGARTVAFTWLAKHHPEVSPESVQLSPPRLQWFKEGLVQGLDGKVKLAYYLEITNRQHLRDYLLIDAQEGLVIEHYEGICELAERRLFVGNTNAPPIWQDGDAFPSVLTAWQQQQLETSEEVYYLFKNAFGRMSYDNLDGDLLLVDEANFLQCPNASWNGVTTNFCNGIGSDDVVGHEWAHAFTEYTSDLLYAWQAGAINEAYSDIWGETIDLLNSSPEENAPRTECASGERWLIGEEATVLGGAIRDLWQPNCYGKPGKVSDPEYRCSAEDFGGVHSNSGVVAHAYALLVDGGEFNGYEIPAIGLDKAAHLFWQAQAYYLGRVSDFNALADALTAAYLDLREAELPLLTISEENPPVEGVFLTSTDSLAVDLVIKATELRLSPDCPDFERSLQGDPPAFCLANGQEFTPFFVEDFEEGIYQWLLSTHPVHPNSWVPRQWALTSDLPQGRAGQGVFAGNPNVGNCDTMLNNGMLRLQSPLIEIAEALEGRVYLTFDHYFSLEEGFDGGNVKIQQNGGNWMTVPTTAFLFNTYNDILPQPAQTDNPLAGQRVFTGADIGAVTGSWGTSQIDLSVIGVVPGENIRLRWELGTDGCNGWDGWYLDNIKVGTCAARVLPVEWLGFTATLLEDKVLLAWETAREEDNVGFYVERSTDGRDFTALGFVPAQGEEGHNYSFVDGNLPLAAPYLYYRLRQEDVDGSSSYSVLREVKLSRAKQWMVYPNPTRSVCYLRWPAAPFTAATVSLRDLNGRCVQTIPEWQPTQALMLDLQNFPSGVYLLRVETEEEVFSERIIVE